MLTSNQAAVYDEVTEQLATRQGSISALTEVSVPAAEMRFEESPVAEVLRSLIKAYAIDIAFNEKSLSDCVLTSSFLEEGLYDRIDVICTAIGATYTIVDARIIIESKGCNLKTD